MNPTPSLAALRSNPLPRAMRPHGLRLGDLTPREPAEPPHAAYSQSPEATQ